MKKSIFSYFSYLVLLFLAVGTLSSCDEETDGVDPAPTISLTPTTSTIEVGQPVDFTYSVVSEKNLEEIRIIYRSATQETVTDFTNNDSHSGAFTFVAEADDANTTVTVTVEAVDKDGNSSSQSAEVVVAEVVEEITVDAFPAVLLGAQDNASEGSFLDANTGNVYSIAEAKANAASVDMAYLQGSESNGQGAVIGSLSDASVTSVFSTDASDWSVTNNTRFKNTTLSEADFNAFTYNSELTAAYAAGTEPDVASGDQSEGSASRVNQLTAGKVFAFQTVDGKDGLAYVVSIAEGTTGTITLNIKVSK
ncbi:hypothetical protein Fleli_0917 [Bernardetia litoralis DSM 6794]|uniref:Uncharacterized protein n=1 Tax=Bernardetia litoralis (strain ATCC 23117 / DSM 6794 / NBRC 15988 / NCIMB 1366 / Fx l1 / Sio-4) TaxID=880071 RepID=I4AHD6_BERLS|nr:hypothetical protein [Bernardetia litoralis]AFM03371.1 hypothetical protein Fleli_0917 [Bernardetia litoralis DSM 6794]